MSEIYRDPTEGATAKRQDLLRRRRDELATMPHAIRRVVVSRNARASAGLGLTIGGVALLVFASSPRLTTAFDHVLPGVQPAGASTILCATWLLALAAYMISRSRSEHRFAVAMSRYVLPGDDLDHDLQRLDHEHPDEVARGMAHRREVASAAWPVLGAALAIPPILMYVAQAVRERSWPVMSTFERALGSHGSLFVAYGVAGFVGALAMTRRPTRAPGAFNALVAIAVAWIGAAIAIRSTALGAVAVVPMTMALVVRRLRVERTSIAAHDPAAGSELFSVRDVLRATWAKLRVIGRYAGAPATLRTTIALVLVAGGWHYMHRAKPLERVATPSAVQDVVQPAPTFQVAAATPSAHATMHDGVLSFDLDLAGKPVVVQRLAELAQIPPGWAATIDVHVEGDRVAVTPFASETPVPIEDVHRFERDACYGHNVELALTVAPTRPTPSHVTVYVTPRLAPAECPDVE